MNLLFYCRSGYETDLLAELERKYADKGQFGYAKLSKASGVLRFILPQVDVNAANLFKEYAKHTVPSFNELVFARQKLLILEELDLDKNDRIASIIDALQVFQLPVLGDVFVEHADTEDGKQIAKFCKKFVVPLRNALRKQNKLSNKADKTLPYLHLFFDHSQHCILALSIPNDRSEYPMGIFRLKMPSQAPSRSTLKLEEAIKTFFTHSQAQALFTYGMRAVDLGACPGGWTYQLVARKVKVEAVDHGLIDDSLMSSGYVEYYSEDGFLYQPQHGNADWLVCDMIEQPTRVSKLMLSWLTQGKANACIFNLKLPMSKREKVVSPILEIFKQTLNDRFGDYILKCKHLYHNRDEVTVMILVNSQMLAAYKENV